MAAAISPSSGTVSPRLAMAEAITPPSPKMLANAAPTSGNNPVVPNSSLISPPMPNSFVQSTFFSSLPIRSMSVLPKSVLARFKAKFNAEPSAEP